MVLVAAEIAGSMGLVNLSLFPTPSMVVQSFWDLRLEFSTAFLQTILAVFIGFTISSFLGLSLAMLLAQFNALKNAVLPFAIFFQTVPIIAIAPLLVIYFGFGLITSIASSIIVSIFPVIANTLIGLESVAQDQRELFQIYRATRWQYLFKLQLPQAYIAIYSGLKTAAGLSVIGVVAGEFVAGGGLGSLIDSARTQQRIDLVYAALVLLSVIGLFMIGLLKLINKLIQIQRPYGLNLRDS